MYTALSVAFLQPKVAHVNVLRTSNALPVDELPRHRSIGEHADGRGAHATELHAELGVEAILQQLTEARDLGLAKGQSTQLHRPAVAMSAAAANRDDAA